MLQRVPKRLFLLLLLTNGCGEDFSPPSLVEDFRILAIQSSSPEIPITGSTDLTPLAFPAENIEYAWSVCLFNTGPANAFECISPALECCLGTGETMVLSLPDLLEKCSSECAEAEEENSDPPVTESAIGEIENQLFEEFTEKGGPILVRLIATHGGDTIEAVKSVIISGKDKTSPNQNPILAPLRYSGSACQEEESCVWEPDFNLQLHSKEDLIIEADVTDESLEPYQDEDDEQIEEMTFAWFATDGELREHFTGGIPTSNLFTAPEVLSAQADNLITMWIVVRDGRGGVTWLERTLTVTTPVEAGEVL